MVALFLNGIEKRNNPLNFPRVSFDIKKKTLTSVKPFRNCTVIHYCVIALSN